MSDIQQINQIWKDVLKKHFSTPLVGDNGKTYMPVNAKTVSLLNYLWDKQKKELFDIGQALIQNKIVKFFGDPHFQHANIINLCHREFSSVEEMDEKLHENILQAHKTSDFVVCVGDISLKNPLFEHKKLVSSFANKHVMLIGNHDTKGATPEQWNVAGAFASLAFSLPTSLVRQWMEEKYGKDEAELVSWKNLPNKIHFGVSHWPVPSKLFPKGAWINIHGHIHNRQSKPLCINCSVEAINYHPAKLQDLISLNLIEQLCEKQKNSFAFNNQEHIGDGRGL